MERWREQALRMLQRVERRLDERRYARPAGTARDAVRIAPYRGFGTAERWWVRARVLRGPELPAAGGDAESAWQNLRQTLRRFESDEVPHARLRVAGGGASTEAAADEEGHLACWLQPIREPTAGALWQEATLQVLSPASPPHPACATAPVLVPPPDAAFGVVSDLDDTVLRSDATRLLRLARTVLFGSARTRVPFPGVAAFYRALQQGAGRTSFNPIFYVSSSPWNLYELLSAAVYIRNVTPGPRRAAAAAALALRTERAGSELLLVDDTAAAAAHAAARGWITPDALRAVQEATGR